MCRGLILLTALASLLGPVAAQAQESYIVVHALNPEGVEIGSIEGMPGFSFSVELFDGTDFIGYSPYNAETHNVPIPIAPGTHTIKAKFNGMELSQNMTLQEGEAKVVTFTFGRTEFDLSGLIDGLDFNADLEINREFHLSYSESDPYNFDNMRVDDSYLVNIPDEYGGWNLFVAGAARIEYHFGGEASMSGMYKAIAEVQLSSTGYYEYLFAQHQLWEVSGNYQPSLGSIAGWGQRHSAGSFSPINIPVYTSFHSWFIQFIGSGKFPEMYGYANDGYPMTGLLCGWAGMLSEPTYELYGFLSAEPPQCVGFMTYHWNEPLSVGGTYEGISHTINGTISNLKMSSVLYDVLGTGIHCGGGGPQPPECEFDADDPVLVNEADGMVLPYDRITLAFVFTNDASTPAENVHVKLDSMNESIFFEGKKSVLELDLGTIDAHGSKELDDIVIEVDGIVDEPGNKNAIMTEIIEKKGQISLEDAIEATITSSSCPGSQTIVQLSPIKIDDVPQVLAIQYPDLSELTGTPEPKDDIDDFYSKRGDVCFHHPASSLVRKFAVEACVGGTGSFPDTVSDVAANVYAYIDGLLGDDSPRWLHSDEDIIKRIGGDLLPGDRCDSECCITQAYLFGSFARTLGISARELTIALGVSASRNNSGVLGLRYSQEGAVQLWYSGDWHLYDTYLEINTDFPEYVRRPSRYIKCFAYHSYDQRSDPHEWSLYWGHEFSIDPIAGYPVINLTSFPPEWMPIRESEVVQEGIIFVLGSPVRSYLEDSQGNITGYIGGSGREDIPYSYYLAPGTHIPTDKSNPTAFWEADETIFVGGDSQPATYLLAITGTNDGHYELILAYIHQNGEIDGSTIQSDIRKDETHTYDINVSASGDISITGVPARIDIEPDTMNLSAVGRWVTCYIELPEGFDVNLIDGETVQLDGIPSHIGKEDWAKAESNQWNITDHDEDGIPERMVKFDSLLVQLLLAPGDATLTVRGGLIDGTIFEGTDNIRVINPRAK